MTADDTALALTIGLAVLIGVSLGLLGGGGSILAVPLLVYVADLPAKEAIATSLLVVGATSVVGVLPHARAHRVRWRTGLLFGFAGMIGAYIGGRLAGFIPAGVPAHRVRRDDAGHRGHDDPRPARRRRQGRCRTSCRCCG